MGAVIPVLPVPLVASVFTARHDGGGRPLSALELKAAAHRLLADLAAAGARVYIPRRDQDYAVEAGLRMLTLRHLVEEDQGLYRARTAEMPLLRYYASSIAHLLPASATPPAPARIEA